MKLYQTKSVDMDNNDHSKWTSSDGAAGTARKAFKSARHVDVVTVTHEVTQTRDGILALLNEVAGSTLVEA